MTEDEEQLPAGMPAGEARGEGSGARSGEAGEEGAGDLAALVAGIDQEMGAAPEEPEPGAAPGSAAAADAGGGSERIVTFSLAGTRYALPLGDVLESGTVPALTAVPHVPEWVRGVANLRGDVIAVVDLRLFLGLGAQARTGSGRMLVVHLPSGELVAGLLVDEVHGISRLEGEGLRAPTAAIADRVAPFLRGVAEAGGRLLAVLDLKTLVQSEDFQRLGAS